MMIVMMMGVYDGGGGDDEDDGFYIQTQQYAQMWPSTTKGVVMCQAYFCSSKEFAAGMFWDVGCNCFRNHLSLVCNMEILHFSVFHGQNQDFNPTLLF